MDLPCPMCFPNVHTCSRLLPKICRSCSRHPWGFWEYFFAGKRCLANLIKSQTNFAPLFSAWVSKSSFSFAPLKNCVCLKNSRIFIGVPKSGSQNSRSLPGQVLQKKTPQRHSESTSGLSNHHSCQSFTKFPCLKSKMMSSTFIASLAVIEWECDVAGSVPNWFLLKFHDSISRKKKHRNLQKVGFSNTH